MTCLPAKFACGGFRYQLSYVSATFCPRPSLRFLGYSDALAEKLAYEEKKCTIVRKRVRECRAPPGNKVGFAVDTFVKYGSIKKEIELKPLGPCMEGNMYVCPLNRLPLAFKYLDRMPPVLTCFIFPVNSF